MMHLQFSIFFFEMERCEGGPRSNFIRKKQTKQQSERILTELEMSERNKREKELYNPY